MLSQFGLLEHKIFHNQEQNADYIFHTFSPAELLLLPSASLAERAPMPTDGNTEEKANSSACYARFTPISSGYIGFKVKLENHKR